MSELVVERIDTSKTPVSTPAMLSVVRLTKVYQNPEPPNVDEANSGGATVDVTIAGIVLLKKSST